MEMEALVVQHLRANVKYHMEHGKFPTGGALRNFMGGVCENTNCGFDNLTLKCILSMGSR